MIIGMNLRTYRKKYARRVKKFVKKRYGGRQGLSNIYRDLSMLKTAINSERKYFDQENIIPFTPTDANFTSLVPWDGLTQGSGEQQRVGDQVKALYTLFRARFELNTTSTTVANTHTVRVMVVVDKDSRYEAPVTGATVAQGVLQTIASGPLQLISPYKVDQAVALGSMGERWKVLRDFKITLDNVKQKQKNIEILINYKNYSPKRHGQVIRYDSANNQTVNPRMYILFLTDNGVTDGILVNAYSRLCYVDT